MKMLYVQLYWHQVAAGRLYVLICTVKKPWNTPQKTKTKTVEQRARRILGAPTEPSHARMPRHPPGHLVTPSLLASVLTLPLQ
jgi:hypothetical protein